MTILSCCGVDTRKPLFREASCGSLANPIAGVLLGELTKKGRRPAGGNLRPVTQKWEERAGLTATERI